MSISLLIENVFYLWVCLKEIFNIIRKLLHYPFFHLCDVAGSIKSDLSQKLWEVGDLKKKL